MLAEMLRACVTRARGINISSEELGIQKCNTMNGAEPLRLYVPPDSISVHPEPDVF